MWQLVIIGVVVIAAVMSYNSLVRLRESGDAAWADIDVQLKRRYDLIPNIVETVKGYASHERKTLESVVAARSGAIRDATRLRIPSVVGRGIRHRPQR
jgi:LemA protein|tara:strand:- start:341 stop:634 length:294 start_codon:yes stop_codon:yes gene_type:complete